VGELPDAGSDMLEEDKGQQQVWDPLKTYSKLHEFLNHFLEPVPKSDSFHKSDNLCQSNEFVYLADPEEPDYLADASIFKCYIERNDWNEVDKEPASEIGPRDLLLVVYQIEILVVVSCKKVDDHVHNKEDVHGDVEAEKVVWVGLGEGQTVGCDHAGQENQAIIRWVTTCQILTL